MLGLVAAASAAGFDRLTLFELHGPGGVMGEDDLFPAGHALAELAALAESAPEVLVVPAPPHDRARALTLALRAGHRLRLYVFNPTPRAQDVVVTGLPMEAWHRSVPAGATHPLARGGATRQKTIAADGGHTLRVGAHDLLALDAETETS
jgi:hypothetical protein